jgi:hypothetical protein
MSQPPSNSTGSALQLFRMKCAAVGGRKCCNRVIIQDQPAVNQRPGGADQNPALVYHAADWGKTRLIPRRLMAHRAVSEGGFPANPREFGFRPANATINSSLLLPARA